MEIVNNNVIGISVYSTAQLAMCHPISHVRRVGNERSGGGIEAEGWFLVLNWENI